MAQQRRVFARTLRFLVAEAVYASRRRKPQTRAACSEQAEGFSLLRRKLKRDVLRCCAFLKFVANVPGRKSLACINYDLQKLATSPARLQTAADRQILRASTCMLSWQLVTIAILARQVSLFFSVFFPSSRRVRWRKNSCAVYPAVMCPRCLSSSIHPFTKQQSHEETCRKEKKNLSRFRSPRTDVNVCRTILFSLTNRRAAPVDGTDYPKLILISS